MRAGFEEAENRKRPKQSRRKNGNIVGLEVIFHNYKTARKL